MKTIPIIENKQLPNKTNEFNELKKPFSYWIKYLQIKKELKSQPIQPNLKCSRCNSNNIVKSKVYTNIECTHAIDCLRCTKCEHRFVIKT